MTWTSIPDENLEPNRPIRSVDGIALRDNPIAIANGDAGAPRIQTTAIQNFAVTTAKIANTAVTTAKVAVGAITRNRLSTSTATVSGTAGSGATSVGMQPYAFFPNIRVVSSGGSSPGGRSFVMTRGTGDSTGPDNPGFALHNPATSQDFSIQYRYIAA